MLWGDLTTAIDEDEAGERGRPNAGSASEQ